MNDNVPGKGAATGSLVCGIIACVLACFSSAIFPSIIAIVLGIVGIVLSANAKKAGFNEGIRTAGFVLSLIGLILGAILLVCCIACGSCLGCIACSMS